MSRLFEWILFLASLVPSTYAFIRKDKLTDKQFNNIFLYTIFVWIIIELKGSIGIDSLFYTLTNIVMWISIVTFTIYALASRSIKRLAMVLLIPGTILLFRLIDIWA